MSWLNLEGKSVIVTGGASGIGKAIVEELLADGAQVAVCDMNPQPPVFEGNTENMIYIHTDVTSRQSVEDMVKRTVDAFGKLDAIVNNAGINIPRMLVDEGNQYELDETVWDKVMNVNLKGLYFCAQAAAKVMVHQGFGTIINMSSESGLEGSEGQSVYAASKNAVNSLTRSWAKELSKKGLRVNTLFWYTRYSGSDRPSQSLLRNGAGLHARHYRRRASRGLCEARHYPDGQKRQADGSSKCRGIFNQ